MNKFFTEVMTRYNVLSFRERLFVLLGILGLLYMLWKGILFGILLIEEQDLMKRDATAKQQISALKTQADTLSQVIAKDPTQNLKNQITQIKNENLALDKAIKEKTNKMVIPKEMVSIVKNIVATTKGLTILKMESLAAIPLFKDKAKEESAKDTVKNENEVQVYMHRLTIELSGGYYETYEFLKKIEDSKMKVFWDELQYEVETYPKANIKVTLHTLSLDPGFIGV